MQAARGTSLSPSDSAPSSPPVRRPRVIFALIAFIAVAIDLGTKQWALHALADRDIEVFGEWFQFHLVFNPGAAFGTGTEYTIVFSCLALVAMVVVLWFSRQLANRFWAVGLGLILGGVAGNFIDRLFREPGPMHGHVIDFLMLPNWPVFNIADICLNVGAGVIIVQSFRGIGLDGTRDSDKPDEADEADKPDEAEEHDSTTDEASADARAAENGTERQ